VELGAYFRGLSTELPTPLPKFPELLTIINRQSFHNLPPIPDQYQTVPRGSSARSPAAPAAGGLLPPPFTPTIPLATPAPRSPASRDPGPRLANPNPTLTWQTALDSSAIRLAQLRDVAPHTTDPTTNQLVPLCLSFHLRGSCYGNCQRAATHRPLSAVERRSLQQLVTDHITSGTPLPAAPGGGRRPPPPRSPNPVVPPSAPAGPL
jgi:hypothetical protein